MPIDPDTLRRRCAEEMGAAARGFGGASWLRDAFLAVPREHFTPSRVWWPSPREDCLYNLIDRDECPNAWLKAVYSPGVALITQIDDGLVPPDGPAKGAFSSSLSSSGVIIELIHHLAPPPRRTRSRVRHRHRIHHRSAGHPHRTTDRRQHRNRPRHRRRCAPEPRRAGPGRARHHRRRRTRTPSSRPLRSDPRHRVSPPDPPAVAGPATPRRCPPRPLDSPFGCDLLVRLTGAGDGSAHGQFLAKVDFMRFRGQRKPRPYAVLGWPENASAERWQELRVEAGPHRQQIIDSAPPRPLARSRAELSAP